jgi:RHS repeat-associated protein
MNMKRSRIDIVIRVLVIISMIFGCMDSVVLFQKWNANRLQGEQLSSNSENEIPVNPDDQIATSIPETEAVQYAPLYEENKGLVYDEPVDKEVSSLILDDDILVQIISEQIDYSKNGLISLHVTIKNQTQSSKNNLRFVDNFNGNFEFVDSQDSDIKYDTAEDAVVRQLVELKPFEEILFDYNVRLSDDSGIKFSGEQALLHTVSVYDKEIMYVGTLVLLNDIENQETRNASILSMDGGWGQNGTVSIYTEPSGISENALAVVSYADQIVDGPQMQFSVDLYSLENQTVTPDQLLTLNSENVPALTEPATLQINFDSIGDLENIPAGEEPYVATYDENAKVWVKVPVESVNVENNTLSVQASHFSVWGAGLGSSLPQNGANVLLFDQPYVSLFTGRASYELPIWSPSGRAGLNPSVALTYSSRTVDGVLGDIQAPWVGMGWNIDSVEIVRKITTDKNAFGFKNEFALSINGTVYSLVEDPILKGRYHTEDASFYYIQRHSPALGNDAGTPNATKEWWEVVSTTGVHYRLGWLADSEQVSMMPGYYCTNGYPCTSPIGAYSSLGYAGIGVDVVAMRWRVDRVTDVHRNYIEYHYYEETKNVGSIQFDHASYLSTIDYTGHLNADGSIDTSVPMAYQIKFTVEDRPAVNGDNPTSRMYDWDNYEGKRLDTIEIIYHCAAGSTCEDTRSGSAIPVTDVVLRTYDFSYQIHQIPSADGTQVLDSIAITAGGYREDGADISFVNVPEINFAYTDLPNRAETNPLIEHFVYPRLVSVDNGYGADLTFTYSRDNRAETYWYNYRVDSVAVDNGFDDIRTTKYTYSGPVYIDSDKELLGYGTIAQSSYDFNQTTVLAKTQHTYSTTYPDYGKELITEVINPSNSTVYQKTVNTWAGDNTGVPSGVNFRYISQVDYYQFTGSSLGKTKYAQYIYNPFTGNLREQRTFQNGALFSIEYYEYGVNSNPAVYLLGNVLRATLTDSNGVIQSDTRYRYDGSTSTVPTVGDLTLVQNLVGTAQTTTVDTGYSYDTFGNLLTTTHYKAYGSAGQTPVFNASTDQRTQVTYDTRYQMIPTETINSLGEITSSTPLFSLGVARSQTDANQETVSYTYDGLGRVVTTTANGFDGYSVAGYAGYTSKTIYPQTYLTESASGKKYHLLEMQIWDPLGESGEGQVSPGYRSIWGIYDGQGNIRQTQLLLPDGSLQLSDVALNAQGLSSKQSEPYILNSIPGSYYPINWDSTQHTTTVYDFMGRVTSSTSADNRSVQYSYPFLAKESIDAAGHKKRYEYDLMDRLEKVKEYTGTSSNYSLYSTMSYTYDIRNNLLSVTDQEGARTRLGYDWLSRKLYINSPDMGQWSYAYDASGSLIKQTDARNQSICLYYDPVNRLTGKNYASNGTCISQPAAADLEISYTYGDGSAGKPYGYRTGMTDESGTTTWDYADSGRTIAETRQISGRSYQFTTHADYLGRVYQQDDPGETTEYHYDITGRVTGMDAGQDENLISFAYNTYSQIESINFQQNGNRVTRQNTYDSLTHRLENLKVYTGDTWNAEQGLMNFDYTYDLLDNITSINDQQEDETFTYTYDDVNRLISAEGTRNDDLLYRQQYTYNTTGNILSVANWRYTYYPVGSYEEDYSGLKYTALWVPQTLAGASGGKETLSGTTGASLTFYFEGSSISYYRRVGPDQGIVEVYIDDKYLGDIDNYAATEAFQQMAVIPADAGKHKLTLKVSERRNDFSSGGGVNIDRLDVLNETPEFTATPTITWTPSTTPSPTYAIVSAGTYQENDAMLQFTGEWQIDSGEVYVQSAQKSTIAEGAEASFVFNGNRFSLIHSVGPDHGIAEICLDAGSLNESCQDADFYSATAFTQVATDYEVPYGMHRIRISYTGRKNESATAARISLDQISIVSDLPTETPTASDTATITLTPSETPVPSETPLPSESPLPSETEAVLQTNTIELTETVESTGTETQISASTETETLIPTLLTSAESSETPTADLSVMPTLTMTGSLLLTDTNTVEASITLTPENTYANTATNSLTNTAMNTATNTTTSTVTNTATNTVTPVVSNVASGKTVSQSSQLNSSFPASNAIDANTSTFTHTNGNANEWWQIDLGNVHQLNTIKVWNRLDCCQERFSNFYILISNVPFSNYDLQYTRQQPGIKAYYVTGNAGSPTTVNVNTTGRYIRIQLAGTNSLSISEFQALGYMLANAQVPTQEPVNLALNKPAQQSSQLNSSYPASKGVDGSISSFTHTNGDANAWWQVDIGNIYYIETLKLWNRQDCCSERLTDFYIFISNDAFVSTNILTTQNQIGVKTFHITGTAPLYSTINVMDTGRYIRIQLAGTNSLSIGEIIVQGYNTVSYSTSTPIPTKTITLTPTLTFTPSLTPTYMQTNVPTEQPNVPGLIYQTGYQQSDKYNHQFTFTVPAGGDDKILMAGVQASCSIAKFSWMQSGVTGWVDFPLISNQNNAQLGYLQNLSSGNYLILVNANCNANVMVGVAIFDNVDPTKPFGRIITETGTGLTFHSDIYANPDEMVVSFAGAGTDRQTLIAPQSGQSLAFRSYQTALGYQLGSTTMSWGLPSNATWSHVLVALKPNHTLQDTNSRIDYHGNWYTASDSRFSGGTEHIANALGMQADTYFYGNQLKIYYSKNVNRGIARICIDEGTQNESCRDVDQYASAFSASNVTTFLVSSGGHLVSIHFTGTRNLDSEGFLIGLDKFLVADFHATVTPTFTPTVTNTFTPTPYANSPKITNSTIMSFTEYDKAYHKFSFNIPENGDNRLLLVHVAHHFSGEVSKMVFNDVEMARLLITSDSSNKSEIWYLKNPAVGSHKLEVFRNNTGYEIIQIISLSDVSSSPFGYRNGIIGSALQVQQSFSASANDLVLDFVNRRGPCFNVPGAGQSNLLGAFILNKHQSISSMKIGATQMSWSWAAAISWTHQVVVIRAMGNPTSTPTATNTFTPTSTFTPSLTPTPTPLVWPTPILAQTPQAAGVYQENNPAWFKDGIWQTISDAADSGSARMEATLAWSLAQLTFTGNQLTYTFKKGPAYGIAELYVAPVDGSSPPQKVASVDQYNSAVQSQQTVAITLPQSSQARILIIRRSERKHKNSTGLTINLDALTVGTQAELTLAPTKSPTNVPATATATVNALGINRLYNAGYAGNSIQAVHPCNVPETGNNRILMVGIGVSGQESDILSVTYNGQPLQLAAQTVNDGVTQMWYLTNPPTGWHSVVITFSVPRLYKMGMITFNGVDQLEPIRTFNVNEQYAYRSFTSINSPTGDVVLSVFTGGPADAERPVEERVSGMNQIVKIGDGNPFIMSTMAGAGTTYMEYAWNEGMHPHHNDIILVSLRKYNPSNVTSTPSTTPTPGNSPTPTPTPGTATVLPTDGMFTQNYTYGASQPHAVTRVDRETRQDHFTYDVNGNQITRLVDGVNYTLSYDEENRIAGVQDNAAAQTWSFGYDGDGNRIRQVNPDGSQTLFLNGGAYQVEIAADTTESVTRYYTLASQRLAMRNADGSIDYLLGDHLGSVSAVVNTAGEVISQSRYLPFGELLWSDGDSPTDYSYTSQRSLSDLSLMDYNARFYDPLLGRFTSPDSIVPDAGSVVGYNRYVYVNNNPVRYTDPSGHKLCEDGDCREPNKYEETQSPDICTISIQGGGAGGASGYAKKFWSFDIVITRKTKTNNSKMAFYLSQSVDHAATESSAPLYYEDELWGWTDAQKANTPYRYRGQNQTGLLQGGFTLSFGQYWSPNILRDGIDVYTGPSYHQGGSAGFPKLPLAYSLESSYSVDPVTGIRNNSIEGYSSGWGISIIPTIVEGHIFAYDSQPILINDEYIFNTPDWLYSWVYSGMVPASNTSWGFMR